MSGSGREGRGSPETPPKGPALVRCPTCGREVPWVPASRWRPFCSERCRLIDLGEWAAERYRIPGEEAPPAGSGRPGEEG